ncbi:hypothetical protein KY339_05290 [Candidatus Woesearchaeota archaeon]|nr:hypothetical protein [Candidatus Woesearchaeota archaeon]
MCFTPAVSLTTFAIEFIIATAIILFFRRSIFHTYIAIFIYLLGFYQLTEFMLCTSGNPVLWVKLGFITYTILPALGLDVVIRITNWKHKSMLVYTPTIVFSLIAIFAKNFVIQSGCSTFFVMAQTMFISISKPIHMAFYWAYFMGFVAIMCFILGSKFRMEKNLLKKKIYNIVFLSTFFSLVPALVLLIIFPSINFRFSSIYCEFALLATIAGVIGVYLNHKHQIFK